MNNQSFSKPFFLAVLLHVVLFMWLFSSFTHSQNFVSSSSPSIIKAVAINNVTKKIESPQEKVEQEKKILEPPVKKELPKQEPSKDTTPQDKLVKKSVIDQKKIEIEMAKEKQKTLLAIKKAEKIAKQKAVLAEKKKHEAAAKKMRQLMDADLQKQLAAEERSLHQTKLATAAAAAEIDKYKAMILQAMQQQWIVPPNSNPSLTCQLLIHIAPGGMVLDVKLTNSSGDAAFDRSAIAAVHKASPLPVPVETALFNAFRDLNLTVVHQE